MSLLSPDLLSSVAHWAVYWSKGNNHENKGHFPCYWLFFTLRLTLSAQRNSFCSFFRHGLSFCRSTKSATWRLNNQRGSLQPPPFSSKPPDTLLQNLKDIFLAAQTRIYDTAVVIVSLCVGVCECVTGVVGGGVGVRLWVGCPCPPVRNDIVAPRHLLFLSFRRSSLYVWPRLWYNRNMPIYVNRTVRALVNVTDLTDGVSILDQIIADQFHPRMFQAKVSYLN